MKPKISIITPSFNQAQFIEETISSVFEQGYENLEYIIIDGGSTDESVNIIRKYENRLAYWISEKDRGQAHALNKGLKVATGDLIAYLNSDDLYLPNAFVSVVNYFDEHPDCDWLCGDTIMFGESHPRRLIPADVPRTAGHALAWAYTAAQPGMFWKRELLEGGFNDQWRYCFDHELYVRLLVKGFVCEHLPVAIAGYRLHAASKTIAEANLFDREFDAIAEIYEPLVSDPERRWSTATRYLRLSCAASAGGRRYEAARNLVRAVLIHPKSLYRRPFWGCLRRIFFPQANLLASP